jgi:hypothetical protein
VSRVTVLGGTVFKVTRNVTLTVPSEVAVAGRRKGAAALVAGARVTVTTAPVTLGLRAQKAAPGALSLASVSLG